MALTLLINIFTIVMLSLSLTNKNTILNLSYIKYLFIQPQISSVNNGKCV